jgi:hypothetical protein
MFGGNYFGNPYPAQTNSSGGTVPASPPTGGSGIGTNTFGQTYPAHDYAVYAVGSASLSPSSSASAISFFK